MVSEAGGGQKAHVDNALNSLIIPKGEPFQHELFAGRHEARRIRRGGKKGGIERGSEGGSRRVGGGAKREWEEQEAQKKYIFFL